MTATGGATASRAGGALPLGEVRALAASVAASEDQALLRLVRLLDRLPHRGEADRVLEPARTRLQLLRPPRPMRFARLLFTPADGAIVAPAAWRRGRHEVPRSALAPLAAAIEAGLGALGTRLREEIEGRDMGDAAALAGLGARLWPAAAEALPPGPPPGWAEAGLAPEDHAPIRALLRPLLAAGEAILAAQRAALAGPAAAGPLPLAAALAALIGRAAAPSGVLAAAAEFGAATRQVAARVLDEQMEQPPRDIAEAPPAEGAASAARFFAWTEDLLRAGNLDADRARRLRALQREAVEACRGRILQRGAEEVVAPVIALGQPGAAPPDDADLAAIEAEARGMAALARAARGSGADAAGIDRAMQGFAEQLAAGAPRAAAAARGGHGLTPVERARLVEILAGPDRAAALLGGLRLGGGG